MSLMVRLTSQEGRMGPVLQRVLGSSTVSKSTKLAHRGASSRPDRIEFTNTQESKVLDVLHGYLQPYAEAWSSSA